MMAKLKGYIMTRRKLPLMLLLISSSWFTIGSGTVIADEGVYRERASVTVPNTGMSMEQVENKFGRAPSSLPSVGEPPITRWEYSGFTVYFEHQHVIHSVITS
ncbi:hypothetical protein JYT96_01735 [Gammaproteobacteria bacterium AH-315-C21]|nr:hypothetical protein [Gammaproteobacteria bacterium AH-315-C21]